MTHAKRFALSLLACGSLHACGGDTGDFDPPDCVLTIIVETSSPIVGGTVTARVEADDSGFLVADWDVSFDTQPVSCSDGSACEGQTIAFVPTTAGAYSLRVDGQIQSTVCSGDSATVNVSAPGANLATYRVRVTPKEGGAVQELSQSIPGGGDYFMGDVRLVGSVTAAGIVSDPNATPMAAHLRASRSDYALDAFAGADGMYAAELLAGVYNVDLFPADPTVAPVRLTQITSDALVDIAVASGDTVVGSISGVGGAPLGGARAILSVEGLPSTVGVANGAGDFAASARLGGATRVSIIGPAGSGLPVLEGNIAGVAANSSLEVTYAAPATLASRTFRIETAAGAAIGGAQVTFLSEEIAGAGTVRVDGGAPTSLAGRTRLTAVSDGAGDVDVTLPAGDYSALVFDGAALTLRTLSLGANGGATLATAAAPAGWTARFVSESGGPIEGATVTARPTGVLASHASATSRATSDFDGQVVLDLVGSGSYEIQIDPPQGVAARFQRGAISALPTGVDDVGTIALPGRQLVSGTVSLASGATAARAHVAFFCEACATPDVPVAETLVGADGRFVIALPDAGVGTP